jgi:aminopeptidase-like protein
VKAEYIQQSLQIYLKLIDKLEEQYNIFKTEIGCEKNEPDRKEKYFISCYTNCEVMLSKHGLYPEVGGRSLPGINNISELDMILWLLFYCDGDRSISDISKKINISSEQLIRVAYILEEKGIMKRINNE